MGVVAGFLAGIGMMKWPYLKRALPVSVRRYLQIRSYFRSINKTRNQFSVRGGVGRAPDTVSPLRPLIPVDG